MTHEPPKLQNAFRVTLELTSPQKRLDQVLIEALRKQKDNLTLQNLSRTAFKELFKDKRIRIKGQPATPSSSVARGVTYVDIMGFGGNS